MERHRQISRLVGHEARDDGAYAVAGEQGQDGAADLHDGEQRDDDLRRHGHEQPDGVTHAEAERAQRVGAEDDLDIQVGIGEGAGALRAFFAFPSPSSPALTSFFARSRSNSTALSGPTPKASAAIRA